MDNSPWLDEAGSLRYLLCLAYVTGIAPALSDRERFVNEIVTVGSYNDRSFKAMLNGRTRDNQRFGRKIDRPATQ
jgi:hypothetical protein